MPHCLNTEILLRHTYIQTHHHPSIQNPMLELSRKRQPKLQGDKRGRSTLRLPGAGEGEVEPGGCPPGAHSGRQSRDGPRSGAQARPRQTWGRGDETHRPLRASPEFPQRQTRDGPRSGAQARPRQTWGRGDYMHRPLWRVLNSPRDRAKREPCHISGGGPEWPPVGDGVGRAGDKLPRAEAGAGFTPLPAGDGSSSGGFV